MDQYHFVIITPLFPQGLIVISFALFLLFVWFRCASIELAVSQAVQTNAVKFPPKIPKCQSSFVWVYLLKLSRRTFSSFHSNVSHQLHLHLSSCLQMNSYQTALTFKKTGDEYDVGWWIIFSNNNRIHVSNIVLYFPAPNRNDDETIEFFLSQFPKYKE